MVVGVIYIHMKGLLSGVTIDMVVQVLRVIHRIYDVII